MGASIQTPTLTGVINQQFFIEPLGGPQHPISYLEDFPESLYNTSINSNLVALMYALLGPAGLGTIKRNWLEARLDIEEHGLRTVNLDELYANPLGFARFAEESYELDPEGLLTNEQWEAIIASDAQYKSRAINFL